MTRDILEEFEQQRGQPTYSIVVARVGELVEDRASGFCGDIVAITSQSITVRDRRGRDRQFRYKPGGFLIDGRPVTIVREQSPPPSARFTNSGAVAGPIQRARIAKGRHDAELVQHVWGDELAELAIVVEPMHGIDDLVAMVDQFQPSADRRLGILVDHLVDGSKEDRITRGVAGPHVLVTGHPFVDVWAGIRPEVMGLREWPQVPRSVEWKQGMCDALGVSLKDFWPRLRNQVRTFADLRPELVGAVERLIDFVAPEAGAA